MFPYCIVGLSTDFYSASHSAHQSKALPRDTKGRVRERKRERGKIEKERKRKRERERERERERDMFN